MKAAQGSLRKWTAIVTYLDTLTPSQRVDVDTIDDECDHDPLSCCSLCDEFNERVGVCGDCPLHDTGTTCCIEWDAIHDLLHDDNGGPGQKYIKARVSKLRPLAAAILERIKEFADDPEPDECDEDDWEDED
jgi:hypothetical protein